MPALKIREGECSCGEPIVMRMWEAPIGLCPRHARQWLKSDEKRLIVDLIHSEIVQAGKLGLPELPLLEIPQARDILASFLRRCEREARLRVKVRRAFAWIWAKTIGRIL